MTARTGPGLTLVKTQPAQGRPPSKHEKIANVHIFHPSVYVFSL